MDSLTKPPTNNRSTLRRVAIPLAIAAVVLVAIVFNVIKNRDAVSAMFNALTGGFSVTPSTGLPVNEPPAETPESRDRERYAHANLIRIALNTYERDVKTYPDDLNALVPKQLTEVPVDPSTAQPYAYTKNEGGYVLTFTLESGVFALSSGEHTLTPKGFDIPSTEPERTAPEEPTNVTEIPAENPPSPLPPALPPPPPEEPIVIDTDGDGLSDDQETQYKSDPNKVDTDADGLTDFEEAKAYGTDPSKADTDGDGFADGAEVKAGYNPNGSGKLPTP